MIGAEQPQVLGFELCLSSGILKTIEYNVSETELISVFICESHKNSYLNHWIVPVEVEVTLRPSVSQSVLVSGAHLRPATNFAFALKLSSDSCGFVIL
jgi:hypothetical protein